MMENPNTLEKILTRLTGALRSQTNATLEVKQLSLELKQLLSLVVVKLDHLISSEVTEAQDLREIRQTLLEMTKQSLETEQKVTTVHHNVTEARKGIDEITGRHDLPTAEQLATAAAAMERRPSFVAALGVVLTNVKEHWPHVTVAGGLGAALYHFVLRLLHH